MTAHAFAHLLLQFPDSTLLIQDSGGAVTEVEPEFIEENSSVIEDDNLLIDPWK